MKLLPALLASAMVVTAMPSQAQDANVDRRVKKLEKEMRAVQRKVFPGGAGRFFEPEIKDDSAAPAKPNGGGSTSAVTDLITRVDALETQLAQLTGRVQEQGNMLSKMEVRLKALEDGTAGSDASSDAGSAVSDTSALSSSGETASAASSDNTTTASASGIERPQSDDPAEDDYIYGYRLWAAKQYSEAQTQLKATADKYPGHRRGSFARNLEGRSWLDDGKPATAAKIFYSNYKDNPRGQRAPDSLYFLGVSLTQLNKKAEACEAYEQLETAYPGEAGARLADRLAKGRSKAGC